MQEQNILYRAQVDNFYKRMFITFFPYAIIPFIFLFVPFLNPDGNKLIIVIWLTLMVAIIIMMLISSYKWTLNQIILLSMTDDFFKVEIITKNKRHNYSISKDNIKAILKRQGGRPRILKLTLFDNDNQIASFYSAGRQKMEQSLEEIAYRINKNKIPAANKNIATSGADTT